jgi:hypothetical protein
LYPTGCSPLRRNADPVTATTIASSQPDRPCQNRQTYRRRTHAAGGSSCGRRELTNDEQSIRDSVVVRTRVPAGRRAGHRRSAHRGGYRVTVRGPMETVRSSPPVQAWAVRGQSDPRHGSSTRNRSTHCTRQSSGDARAAGNKTVAGIGPAGLP